MIVPDPNSVNTSGWLCPRCGTSNSPASKTCNGCAPGQQTSPLPVFVPVTVPPTYVGDPLYPWQSPITCESVAFTVQGDLFNPRHTAAEQPNTVMVDSLDYRV